MHLNEEVILNQFRLILLAVTIAALCCSVPASAQTVTIVNGNGQLVCSQCLDGSPFSFRPLVVKVTDASGNPVNGAQVDWTVGGTSGSFGVSLQPSTSFTTSDGIASATLFNQNSNNPNAFQNFLQYTVTATNGTSSVNFFETVGFSNAFSGGLNPIQQDFTRVPVGTSISGQAGTVSTTPLQVGIYDRTGKPVPNVNMFFLNDSTAGPATVQCVTDPKAGVNMVLTDATGIASCTPVFGNTAGNGKASLVIGGAPPTDPTDATATTQFFFRTFPINLTVTPGVAGTIKITQGNNQSLNPGQSVSTQLQVEVDSAAGSPLGGQSVVWSVTPAGAANLVNAVTTTDANGRASSGLALTSTATGTVTVTVRLASDSTKSVSFTITVVPVVSITGFQIVSGSNQSASVSTAFPQPLVVQVTTSAGTAANIPVQFSSNGSI